MARAGTSMVARIVNLMGVYLGAEESLLIETAYNAKFLQDMINSIKGDEIIYETNRTGLTQTV